MANTARQFVAEELAAGHDSSLTNQVADISGAIDVVHVHGAWLPAVHRAAKRAKAIGAKLVIRPAGSYDPLRLRYHAWKKLLMAPWEHAMLRRADVVQATCPQEAEWIRAYLWGRGGEEGEAKRRGGPTMEITDLKRFFDVGSGEKFEFEKGRTRPLHVLYLGRRHPLKGVEYLEKAVEGLGASSPISLRIESDVFGEAKEAAWAWCDVLCLPTLSENFGRVVAEALERGKRVITTDGAPAWDPAAREGNSELRLVYLRGYRDGTEARRVELLRQALTALRT